VEGRGQRGQRGERRGKRSVRHTTSADKSATLRPPINLDIGFTVTRGINLIGIIGSIAYPIPGRWK
jgi:hypothetical protein